MRREETCRNTTSRSVDRVVPTIIYWRTYLSLEYGDRVIRESEANGDEWLGVALVAARVAPHVDRGFPPLVPEIE